MSFPREKAYPFGFLLSASQFSYEGVCVHMVQVIFFYVRVQYYVISNEDNACIVINQLTLIEI